MSSLHRLQRRTFLAALGLGIAAPLALKMSKLAIAEPSGRPARLFMMFIPHGLPWEHFDVKTSGGGFDLKANGLGVLAPLEPWKQHVHFVRGIGMADGATNHGAIRAALTGANDGGNADSIDYVIAKGLGVKAHVLGAIPYRKTEGFGVDSHLVRHGGAWVRALESPVDAADELFEGAAPSTPSPETPSPVANETDFQNEAISLTERQVERLRKQVTGLTAEETKLKVHLEALANLKTGNTGGGGGPIRTSCTARPAMPAVDATAGIDPLDEAQFGKILDAQLELAANAMVCGTAQVITLQTLWVNSNTRFDFPGGPNIPKEHHIGLSHSGAPRPDYGRAQQWIIERVVEKMVKVLDQPDPADAGHTVLENSMIYITSEVSDGQDHNSKGGMGWLVGSGEMYQALPQVIIGGGAGALKPGGRIVQVQDNRQHSDVLASLAKAMGVSVSSVGPNSVSVVEELFA